MDGIDILWNVLLPVGLFTSILVVVYFIECRQIIRYLLARRKTKSTCGFCSVETFQDCRPAGASIQKKKSFFRRLTPPAMKLTTPSGSFDGGFCKANRLLGSPLMVFNHILAVTGLVCILYGWLIEPYRLEITTVRIETEKLSVPLRIVQISDLHCERMVRLEPQLAGFINPLKPDVIVFTGDAINEPQGLELFRKTLTGLNASIGKFAVTGNWDDMRIPELDRFAGTGFELLKQDVRFLEKDGNRFCIAGLGYLQGPHSGPVITKLKPDVFNVFLFHTPDFIVWLKGLPVDLYLCGHTHGGQVALPFLGPVITLSSMGREYGRGLNHYAGITTYTNRGIGMDGGIAPRVRFMARPEITVFEIIPKTKASQ